MSNRFCTSCGKALPDGEGFCGGCGAQAQQSPQQHQQGQAQQDQAAAYSQMDDHYAQSERGDIRNKYHKMGGWLLFFVIVNIISVPIALVRATNEITDSTAAMQWAYGSIATALTVNIIAQVVALAAVALTILWIVQVFQRKSLFLLFMQIGTILTAAANILTLSAIGMTGLGLFENDVITTYIQGLIGSVIGFFLMTLYYCKSNRVRTYMGTDEYAKKAIFAYKQRQ